MPTVTVIIPVYKVERYLDACVESVVRQSYADLEILLVDDGSPDRCPALAAADVCKSYILCKIPQKSAVFFGILCYN